MFNKNMFIKYVVLIILVLSFFVTMGFSFNNKEQLIGDKENPLRVKISSEKVDSHFKFKANLINKSSKPVKIKYSKSPYSMKIKTNEKNPQVVFTHNASKYTNNTKILEPNESVDLISIGTEKIEVHSGNYLADITVGYKWENENSGFVSSQEKFNIPVTIKNDVGSNVSTSKFDELAIRKAIEKALGIELSEVKQYGVNDLDQLLDPENNYLVKVFNDIEKKAMKGDYLPILFINKNTAHFVFHKANGKNFVYSLSKNGDQWDIENIITTEL